MLIQQSPNCITIGEQTAGAVMNISSSILPDNQQFYFTGLGAFYPDGTGLQRKGLKIDYQIKGSVSNFDTELYINEAVKIIEN
jgi:C-terminal processing protease CtpA/Prc